MQEQSLEQRSPQKPLRRGRTWIFLLLVTVLARYTTSVGYAQELPKEHRDFLLKFYTNELVKGSNTFNEYQRYFEQALERREPSNVKELYNVTDLELAYLILLSDIDEEKAKDRLKKLVALWEAQGDQLSTLRVDNLSDYYRAYGEVLSRGVGVADGLSQIIKRAQKAVKMFEKSIEEDSSNAKAYINYGVLNYFTPKIGGGGPKKAKKNFDKALEYTTNDLTRFTTYVWLSQVYFKLKKTSEYDETLKKAESLYPNSFWLTNIKEMNGKKEALK